MRLVTIFLIGAALSVPASAKPTASGARTFLTKLYVPYRTAIQAEPPSLKDPALYYEAGLARMIVADSAEAAKRGEVPNLDGDPICDCQDYEPFKAAIGPVSLKGNRAQADVTFTNFAPKRLRFELVATSEGWRIYDIVSDGHSLRGMFRT